jgi:hypothetical protein
LVRSITLCLILFAAAAAAQVADDPGPSILSRGVGTAVEGGGDLPTIKPFLSLGGVYDTGLTAVSVDATGNIPQLSTYGAELGFGVVGYKRGRRTVLGIDYRGSVRKYARSSYYDGSDHVLTLSVTRQLTGRTSLILREAAGSYARSNGMASGYSPFDPAVAGVPTNELFDSRTTYLNSMANLMFQKSARLSFSGGGNGSLVRRRSGALVGSTGYGANGDVSYRVSRGVTLGADYSYGHNQFTKAVGSSDIHSAGFNATFRVGRRWELGLHFGASRVSVTSLIRLNFDPIIAAILGQPYGLFIVRNSYFVPSSGAKLSRAFRLSVFSLNYDNSPSSGNGIYTTSKSQSTAAGYSFNGLRRLNFGFTAGYVTYSSLSQGMGKYYSYTGGAGATYRIRNWLHLSGGYDARKYDVSGSSLHRLTHRATIGLAFSPGERPLPLW